MKAKTIGAALITIIAGIYIGITEIALLIAGSLVLMTYTGKSKRKTKTKQENSSEQKILHPVVYEDAGDPPNLYPEDGEIEVYPEGKEEKLTTAHMVKSVGNMAKITTKGIKKLIK